VRRFNNKRSKARPAAKQTASSYEKRHEQKLVILSKHIGFERASLAVI
jgi:hypothetical protein